MPDLCRMCPAACPDPDCPHAFRSWLPPTEEEELGAAHEPYEDHGE